MSEKSKLNSPKKQSKESSSAARINSNNDSSAERLKKHPIFSLTALPNNYYHLLDNIFSWMSEIMNFKFPSSMRTVKGGISSFDSCTFTTVFVSIFLVHED